MKKLMIRVVAPLALAAGAAFALASPAGAAPPRQILYHDAATLRGICERADGYFAEDPNGGSYFCVLPDGRVILCVNRNRTCVVLEKTAPKPDDWTPPISDVLQVQGDPGPVPEIAPVTADVGAVPLVQAKR
jgi:hypothetical protein